jgi:hypothetical protein
MPSELGSVGTVIMQEGDIQYWFLEGKNYKIVSNFG